MRVYLRRPPATAVGSRKVMLELFDALTEAWGAVEQELWSLSSGKLRRTAKAKNQQKKSTRAYCATAWRNAKEYVWEGHEKEAQLLNR